LTKAKEKRKNWKEAKTKNPRKKRVKKTLKNKTKRRQGMSSSGKASFADVKGFSSSRQTALGVSPAAFTPNRC
jgi:hypothetical protein